MSNEKAMIIPLVARLVKKTLHKTSQYFPKPYQPFGTDISFKTDLCNYATKADLKKTTGVDMSKLAAKYDLASLKD